MWNGFLLARDTVLRYAGNDQNLRHYYVHIASHGRLCFGPALQIERIQQSHVNSEYRYRGGSLVNALYGTAHCRYRTPRRCGMESYTW